jgi:hypothetical protein
MITPYPVAEERAVSTMVSSSSVTARGESVVVSANAQVVYFWMKLYLKKISEEEAGSIYYMEL